jgi:monoamine oxidase
MKGAKMARTSLMRALQRIAGEHRAASALGMSVEECRERSSGGGFSRRDFMKRTGALGAGVAAGGLALSSARPAFAAGGSPRIAVIGGGIAGLVAAYTLQGAGYASTVYESSGRIGGRMHSDWQEFGSGYWASGQQAELCGELIDTNHKLILSLAQTFKLTTVDLLQAQPNGTTDTYYVNGALYSYAQASNDFQPVHNTLQSQVQATGYPTQYNSYTAAGQTFDNMTVHDWINTYVPGGLSSNMGALLNAAYNEEYGAETTGQSSLNLIYLLGYNAKPGNWAVYGKSDERYHIVGGNSLLPQAIANALPSGSVQLGYFLNAIVANTDGTVTLTFANGKSVTADYVILSLPFAVLRTIDYSKAGFDALKTTAITQYGAGKNAKLNMQFNSRIWNNTASDGSLYTDLPVQSGWEVSRGQSGPQGLWVAYPGANVAASWGQSKPYSTAATNSNVTKIAGQVLTQLEAVYPGITAQWTGKAMLSTPFTDPNLLLAYSYYKPGQYTTFSGYEKVPMGNIHFAGEHCSINFQGYMEGGAEEGQRAANEVISAITGK